MPEGKKGLFGRLVERLAKTRNSIISDIDSISSGFSAIDDGFYEEIEETLIMGDLEIQTTMSIVEDLRTKVKEQHIKELEGRKELLVGSIKTQTDLGENTYEFEHKKSAVLIIGVDDVGKTTSVGKLTGQLKDSGHKVILAAADIFRTAVVEQLAEWAGRAGMDIIAQQEGSDPAAVIYDAVAAARSRKANVLICDTAGRLRNKKNLMEELKKINRIIDKKYTDTYRETLMVLDGTTGQNALTQARQFVEAADTTGAILTKLDGTARGDIAVATQFGLGLPVKYIGIDEQIDDLQKFDADDFVNAPFNVQRDSWIQHCNVIQQKTSDGKRDPIMEGLTLECFEEASDLVKEVTTEIKLVYSEYFPAQTGNRVCFRPENMQYTGAYRMRGAYYKISILSDEEKSKGLITALTGNHTRGVAYAAKLAGVKTTVIMPTITPLMKISRTKGYDAEVVLKGDMFDETCDYVYKLAEERGYTFVHPFDDLAMATGQDIITVEIIKELPIVDYILVPVGGGGLRTGVSTLAKLLNPKIKVIGVEPAGASYMQESPRQGQVTTLPETNTIAGGTAIKRPREKLFPYIQQNVNDIITIEDSGLIISFLDMVENHKMIVESSGLLTVAALKHLNVQKKKIVSILSGDNVDVITMSSIVQHDLIQRNRVFTVSVLLPDKPGEPARVSSLSAKEQGNIIKLEHNQFISVNRNAAVELRITMETFETGHKDQIVAALTGAGYRLKLVEFKGTYSEM